MPRILLYDPAASLRKWGHFLPPGYQACARLRPVGGPETWSPEPQDGDVVVFHFREYDAAPKDWACRGVVVIAVGGEIGGGELARNFYHRRRPIDSGRPQDFCSALTSFCDALVVAPGARPWHLLEPVLPQALLSLYLIWLVRVRRADRGESQLGLDELQYGSIVEAARREASDRGHSDPGSLTTWDKQSGVKVTALREALRKWLGGPA